MPLSNDVGPLREILGFHIRLAHGAVVRHFGEHFSELGLTQKQVSVLWLAHDTPGLAQTDLARRLQMDRATTMGIVHALERRHLLKRGPAQDDKRRIALSLTGQGEAILAEARCAIESHEAWLKGFFTASEIRKLIILLDRIHT